MSRLFSPAFNQQFFDPNNGKPLAAGKLYTYEAGSSTPVYTYKTITGSELNTNPIILDMAGCADFVLEVGASYKFVLKDKDDALIKTWDKVTAADVSSVIEGLITDIEGKADRANPSTNGNLAALDAYGNVKDSHYKPTDFATAAQGAKADTAYQMPDGGIPKSDLASGVQTSLNKADTAYQKPNTGIPKNDLASAVQTSLNKADTAYQKPSGGIPATDMTTAVQNALNLAVTAYQKPSNGIPSSDMTTQVQNALNLALSSMQGYEVDTYDNNPKSRHVLLFTANVSSAAYASCIVKFVNIYGNGNTASSVSVLVTLSARGTSAINVDARVISNNNWDFGSNLPGVMYYVDNVNNTIEVRIALMEYDSDIDNFLATQMNYLRTSVIPLPKAENVTWNLTAHTNGGRSGQINVIAGLTGVYGTLPRVEVNLVSGQNIVYLDRNAHYRIRLTSGTTGISLRSHNKTPVHAPVEILYNNTCQVVDVDWYNNAGYGESTSYQFNSNNQTMLFDVNIWDVGANVVRNWLA